MKSVLAILSVALAVLAFVDSSLAQTPPCSSQPVFDLCKQDVGNYIATCTQHDYACLCRWHTAKLTCWDNCPNDLERGTQEALTTTYCSQPGANVTSSVVSYWQPTSTATSVALPTSTPSGSAVGAHPTNSAVALTPYSESAMLGTALMLAALQILFG